MTGVLDQLTQILQTLFLGPRNWVFVSVVGLSIIAGTLLRRGFKKEVKVEEGAPGVPTAEEYLRKEPEPVEEDANLQPGESKEPQVDSPTPTIEPPLTSRPAIYDPSMEKISLAFDSAKERMIDEFASAITRMKFKITLPEEGKPLKVEPQAETAPPEGD